MDLVARFQESLTFMFSSFGGFYSVQSVVVVFVFGGGVGGGCKIYYLVS